MKKNDAIKEMNEVLVVCADGSYLKDVTPFSVCDDKELNSLDDTETSIQKEHREFVMQFINQMESKEEYPIDMVSLFRAQKEKFLNSKK